MTWTSRSWRRCDGSGKASPKTEGGAHAKSSPGGGQAQHEGWVEDGKTDYFVVGIQPALAGVAFGSVEERARQVIQRSRCSALSIEEIRQVWSTGVLKDQVNVFRTGTASK